MRSSTGAGSSSPTPSGSCCAGWRYSPVVRRWRPRSGCAPAAIVAADHVPDLLAALVDKSLLAVSGDEIPRYRMLETIRAYGLERLDEAGEREALRRAHASVLRRARRDRRTAPAPRRAAGLAAATQSRPRQPQRRTSWVDRRRRRADRRAPRCSGRLVLVARRPQGGGHGAGDRGAGRAGGGR